MWLNSGSGNYDQHVTVNALNLARFGHLYLNGGCWCAEQLLPPSFVKAATTPQTSVMEEGAPDAFAEGRGAYGFGWWVNGLLPNGTPKFEGAPTDMVAASGYNNDMFVLPSHDMVIVRLGLDQCDTTISDAQYGELMRLLLDGFSKGSGTTSLK